ncbi:AAA domain-containing protein [Haloactinopolyspora alba]|uniref:AAA domain-containing protein n=1 Tax=Haloactinopolyspora alba TaxID=648780 RepID=A0A2P8DRB9_9ACTN|nr:AAA family ATPase [Haloactinopolyspora alba]PSK99757.1 AAA domain-containing protein [Haloactinopolyspora alba]
MSEVTTLSAVVPESVQWLWPDRLPVGKLVVLDGDPSTGKSTLTLDLAARVSAGKPWPDGAVSAGPADVLLLSAEDGLGDTVRPRLDAAGADVARVHALVDVPLTDEDEVTHRVPPQLPRDIGHIERIVHDYDVRLVVVDVLMAFLAGGVDSHRDQDVRAVLHRMSVMAERAGCTVLLVRHLNKAGAGSPMYRGGGSIGIIGAARAAYLVARDPDDEGRRIVAVTKSNLAVEPPSLAYRLVDDPDNGCARVEWEAGTVEHTAATLLRGPVDEDERTERDEAAQWLRDYLADSGGQAASKDIFKAARTAGHSERTLKRAKQRAGITHQSSGFPRTTYWELPAQSGQQGQDTNQVAQLDPRGPTGRDQHKYAPQSGQPTQSGQSGHPTESDPTGATVFDFPAPADDCPQCGFGLATIGHRVNCKETS